MTQQNQKNDSVVDFGSWKQSVDENLFEHKFSDSRRAITMDSTALVYNQLGHVCAEKTMQNVRQLLENANGGLPDRNEIRWHTGVELKQQLGSQTAKELITFVHQHL